MKQESGRQCSMNIVSTHSSRAKDFACKSEVMQLIVAAIEEAGKGKLHDDEKTIIKIHLTQVPKTKFEHDIKLAPIWVRKTISEL